MRYTHNQWGHNVSRVISRSKVKVTLVIWSFFHVHFVASYLCDRITSYVAYIQHMRGAMCHTPFSGWKRRWSTSHGSFKVLALSAPCFCPYLTESLHINKKKYIQHMRGQCVASHFQDQRSKVNVTQVVWIFTLSAPWLSPYFIKSLQMWLTYNTWGGYVSHTSFCHLSTWLHAYLNGLWQLRGAAAIRSLDLLVSSIFRAVLPYYVCQAMYSHVCPSIIVGFSVPKSAFTWYMAGVAMWLIEWL